VLDCIFLYIYISLFNEHNGDVLPEKSVVHISVISGLICHRPYVYKSVETW